MHRHRSRWSGRIGIVVLLLASLLPVLSAQSVGAAAITVDSLGDGAAVAANCMVGHAVGTCRLRDALAAAGTGGAITFAVSGTINVNQAQGPLTLALNVTIDGTGATITVDGGCTGCDPGGTPTGGVTVFRVNSGVTAAISSLTIQHGNSSGFGGGIANNGGTLTVTSSTFSANSAPSGGGIANFGTLTVTNGDFSGNSAPNGVGGGIANEIGTLTVTDSFFSTNSASIGGGIYNNGGTLMVARSQFSANATSGGGGITNDNSGNVTVTNGVFSGNSAGSGVGGGIDNRNGGTLTVTSSIFSGNSAFRGGGIYTTGTLAVMNSTLSGNMATGAGGANTGGGIEEEGGAITVTNSIFANNSATGSGGGGGGIEQAEGTLTLTNVTFSGNTSDGGGGIEMSGTGALTVTNSTFSNNAGGTFGGGGILRDDTGAVTVTNSTFSANSGTTGGALFNDNSGPLTLTNTIIAGNTGGNCATALGGTIGDGGHNLQFGDTSCGATIPVQNPQLGMLADNGGTAATVLPNGSHAPTFAITTGSPAFNHGDPAICTAPLPPTGTGAGSMDERGFPRGNGTAGNPSCSIGAFEPQSAAVTITLSPTTLPAASGGIPYSQTLTATGGTAPYTFTVTMGTLPTGLSLSTGGLLSGTPTAGGTFSFTIQAKDANGVTGSQAYTLSVTTPTITLSPATLPGGVRSVAYPATTLAAAGGTA
ncbi:MAG: beta strand repeat-containing protein, partial [Thermomicrobiales bacterium]